MALRRFSDNPAATLPLVGDEVVPALQGGVDVMVTVQDIIDAASGAVTSVNGDTGAVVLALGDLDDVDAATPTDGDVLTWNDTAGAWEPTAGGGSGIVESIGAGTGITVDDTDPANPIVSATGGGSGDVTGPASSTADRIAVFDGTTGKAIKDGGRTIASLRAPAIQSVTSSATVTPTFADDMVIITAQAAALTLANPTGTAINGLGIVIRIKDNGTARGISYGSQYRAIGVTLPTTTVVGKTTYLAMIYNATDTTWDVVAVGTQA